MPIALQNILSCAQCSPLGGACSSSAWNATLSKQSALTCECVNGYSHDTLGFRFASCSLPPYFFQVILILGLAFSNLALLLMLQALHRGRAKGEARKLIMMFGFISVFSSAGYISALAQGYFGVAWFFFQATFFAGMGVAFARFLYLFIRLCYGALDRASWTRNMGWIQRLLVLFVLFLAVPNYAFFLAVAALGDPTDPNYNTQAFNLIMLVSICSNPIYLFISWPLGKLVTDDLISKIDRAVNDKHAILSGAGSDGKNRARLLNVRERLVMFRRINLVYTPASQLPILWVYLPLVFAFLVPALPSVYAVLIPSVGMFTSAEIVILTHTTGLVDSDPDEPSSGTGNKTNSVAVSVHSISSAAHVHGKNNKNTTNISAAPPSPPNGVA